MGAGAGAVAHQFIWDPIIAGTVKATVPGFVAISTEQETAAFLHGTLIEDPIIFSTRSWVIDSNRASGSNAPYYRPNSAAK